MITIVLIKNPFQPMEGREVHQIPYEPGKKVSDYSEAFLTEYGGEFTVRSKTYVVDDTYIPQDGDFIVISPVIGRHKNPLVIVAAIALSVVSMGIGSVAAGGSFMSLGGGLMAASGWSAIYGYLAAAAVMALGGSLIQRAFGTADLNNSTTSDPTYSWSGVSTTTGQGYAIPITYGTVRSGGQILSEYVLNDSNKQYLYRLYSAGQGPLTISDIQLNDNPVGQYEKVYIDTRSGTNDQDIISNFSDTISEKALAYELVEDTWRSDVVTGTATEGIIVSLEASNGLYYTNDNGSLSQAWDEVTIQYRTYGSTSDDDWVSLLSNQFKVGSTTLSGIDISLFSQQGISAGTYDIYVKANPFFGITAKIGDWEAHADGSSVSCGPFTVKRTGLAVEKSGTVTIVAGNVIDSVKIYGSQTSAVRQDFRLDNLPAGQYEVRAKVLSRSSSVDLARASVRIWWTALAGVVYDDFCYPGIALIGMKGLATDQLSGSPTMKFLKTRDTVEVWNPNTGEYEEKDATNPSWASYDFIHQAYKEKNINTGKYEFDVRGASKDLMMYDRFKDWADFCDLHDLKINLEVNTSGELLEILNKDIAPIGHGCVTLYGTKYGPVWDAPGEAVQMFGMGNIIAGSFEEDFLQTSDRANAVEVTFTNKDKNYERDTVTVYSSDYDSSYNRTTEVTMDGITDYQRAYKYGMFLLKCNERQIRTCTFKAEIDAIACTVGDIVLISHDIPYWATSGRISEVNGNTVKMNAIMDNYDSSAQYQITYRASSNDTIYTVNCSVSYNSNVISAILSSTPGTAPSVGDVCSISKVSIGNKPFVIKSITRDTDMIRQISAIEYDEAVFAEDYDIPEIEYSDSPTLTPPTSLILNEKKYYANGEVSSYGIQASWSAPTASVDKYRVYYSTNEETWIYWGDTVQQEAAITNLDPTKIYYVKVCAVQGLTLSSYVEGSIDLSTGNQSADSVTISAETRYRELSDGTGEYSISLTWAPAVNGKVYYKQNNAQAENIVIEEGVAADELGFSGAWISAGQGLGAFTIPQVISGDIYKIAVSTANSLGEYTDPDGSASIRHQVSAKSTIPDTPSGLSIAFTDISTLAWVKVTNLDIDVYEARTDMNPGVPAGMLGQTNGLSMPASLSSRAGTIYLYAKSYAGKYSSPAVLTYNKSAPKTPSAPQVTAKLGGLSIVAGAIPSDCIGMIAYINDTAVKTVNNTLTYTCDAGIYDVTVSYYDLFGEGEKSASTRVTVSVTIDSDDLADMAVTRAKLDQAVQDAVQAAEDSITAIEGINTDISTLQGTMTGVQTDVDGLTSTVNDQGEDITQIKQTATEMSSTVASLSDTVSDNVTQIKQNATSITSVVTKLNGDADADGQYSAIVQLSDGLTLRVKSAEIISQINLSKEGIEINGKLIHITGDTVFDDNVIVGKMIQAGAVTADKMDVTSLSAITGTIGTLRTATSGARTEIKDNLIEVYDANDNLRVKMGVWTE